MKQYIERRMLVAAAILASVLGVTFNAPMARLARAQDLISCDTVRTLGNNWRSTQTGRNIGVVACYQVPGGAVLSFGQTLLIEIRVTSGAFDAFAISGTAAIGEAKDAQQLNPSPILAGTGWQPFAFGPIANLPYTIAIAPTVDGTRGSFQLRMRGIGGTVVPPVQPTPIPLPPSGTIVLPTTFDQRCSTAGVNLSNLCLEAWPVSAGATAFALWRIPNFVRGEFDRGDGAGFRGPINPEMRVEVPNVTVPRVVRLKWTAANGQEYIDSILIQVGGVPAPPASIDPFPCSRPGIGVSNLCVEQPYPARVGSTVSVVWRIASFQYGEFDKGDGAGFKGPVNREQRIDIPNVTAARTVRLRWVDASGVLREDSFTIQVY
jgi:hypothetical protein